MDKLFFVMYKDDSNQFKHATLYRKNKKQIKDELLDRDLTPKVVFLAKTFL